MAHKRSFGLALAVVLFSSIGAAVAQNSATASRLAGDWRSSGAVALPAGKPMTAESGDLGPASANMKLERMLLLLAPSASQRQALTTVLQNQQNPASPEYHHFLTPAAFADAYANSPADATAVADWLRSEGFTVAALPAGRGWIEFSGTVAQVEEAFHTQIHLQSTASGARPVPAGDIGVPAALRPVIEGLVSLDGTLSAPAVTAPLPIKATAAELASETSLAHAEALNPHLATQLLHLDSLHASGVNGSGETIAIAARSNVHGEDIAAFRAAFSLPASSLEIKLAGIDPGRTGDEAEAVLAASWAGVAAPGAHIVLVPAATTSATDGVDLSLAAIVDERLAQTVAVGFSSCEAALSPAHQDFYSALYRQAAAEGIAVIAATGDSGPSACHPAGSDARVSTGYGVNSLASTPWNTAVGVASIVATDAKAQSAWSPANESDPALAGGGGRSILYPAPDWQPIPGTQLQESGTQHRLLPDLALPTAIDSAADRGLAFCLSRDQPSRGCSPVCSGGSSAAAALFAGVAALLEEKYGPQGNLAPHLYALSREPGIFDDVQQGSARLWCEAGSQGCEPDGQIGFTAAPGFDLATGLGTVNADALVSKWKATPAVGKGLASVTNTIGAGQTINPSGSVVLSAKVVSQTGGPAPTGTITFFDQSDSTNIAVVTLVKQNALASTASTTLTGVLTQGGHPIQANYSGDVNYAAADSQPVVVEVEPSSTTIVVKPETTTPTAGSTLAVSATITSLDAGTGASPPSGTVDFRLDGVSQGVKQVTPGSPSTANTLIEVPSSGGSHQIVGFYSGDNNYYNSTSAPATITVQKTATELSLSPATTTPFAGSSLMVTATITAPPGNSASPTGSVTFTLDGVSQGAGVVTPGTPSSATLSITVPSTGNHILGATYSGDSNYTGSTATPVTLMVAKSPTTIAVTPATTTPAPGSSLPITATITALDPGSTLPTGTVTFTLDGAKLGTASVVDGSTANITVTAPASGSHTLQASYGGDSFYSSSLSSTVTIVVAKTPTTIVLTPAATTVATGASLAVKAAIAYTGTVSTQPTGTVTFTLDGTPVGTDPVTAGSPSTSSITIPATALAPGAHVLQGAYSGDSFFSTSTSTSVTITVSKSPTSTVVTPATTTPTAGGSLQVTASITATSPGSTQPTGTVNFTLDGASVGVQTVTAGSPSMATVTIPVLAAGTHLLAGTYSGDTYYATSTSPTVTLIVAKGGTVTTVAAMPAVLTAGVAETLTATITPLNPITGAVYTITGTVSFYDGKTLLGNATISENAASITGVALANNVDHSITAIYSGDVNWLPSISAALLLSASTLPDTVVLTSNIATAPPGQPVVLLATVTPNSPPAATAEQNPSGNVIFYYGTTVLGTVALVPSPLDDSSTATLTINLPGGQDTITAFYAGDLYYDAELSNAINIDVQDFNIIPVPGQTQPINIVQGSSGTAQFDVEGYGGFGGQIQVVCAVPAQDDMTCSVTPSVVVPTAIVTVTVQTYSTGATPPGTSSSGNQEPVWPRAVGGASLALLAFFLLPFGRRARIFAEHTLGKHGQRFLILLLMLAGLGGAGLGCSSVSQPVGSGTPLGVATLKITGAANINNTVYSHSVFLTVDVLKPGSSTN